MFNGVINMAEERYKVTPVGIRYKCDKCNNGYMEVVPNAPVYCTNPLQYLHKCNKCGNEERFTIKYPYIKYE